jgi:hypothetical protein
MPALSSDPREVSALIDQLTALHDEVQFVSPH